MTDYIPALVLYRILNEFGPFLIIGMAMILTFWRLSIAWGRPANTNRRVWRLRRRPEGLRCPRCQAPMNRAASTEWCTRYPERCDHFRDLSGR